MHKITGDIDVHKLLQAVKMIDDVKGREISARAKHMLNIATMLITSAVDEAVVSHVDCGDNKGGAGI